MNKQGKRISFGERLAAFVLSMMLMTTCIPETFGVSAASDPEVTTAATTEDTTATATPDTATPEAETTTAPETTEPTEPEPVNCEVSFVGFKACFWGLTVNIPETSVLSVEISQTGETEKITVPAGEYTMEIQSSEHMVASVEFSVNESDNIINVSEWAFIVASPQIVATFGDLNDGKMLVYYGKDYDITFKPENSVPTGWKVELVVNADAEDIFFDILDNEYKWNFSVNDELVEKYTDKFSVSYKAKYVDADGDDISDYCTPASVDVSVEKYTPLFTFEYESSINYNDNLVVKVNFDETSISDKAEFKPQGEFVFEFGEDSFQVNKKSQNEFEIENFKKLSSINSHEVVVKFIPDDLTGKYYTDSSDVFSVRVQKLNGVDFMTVSSNYVDKDTWCNSDISIFPVTPFDGVAVSSDIPVSPYVINVEGDTSVKFRLVDSTTGEESTEVEFFYKLDKTAPSASCKIDNPSTNDKDNEKEYYPKFNFSNGQWSIVSNQTQYFYPNSSNDINQQYLINGNTLDKMFSGLDDYRYFLYEVNVVDSMSGIDIAKTNEQLDNPVTINYTYRQNGADRNASAKVHIKFVESSEKYYFIIAVKLGEYGNKHGNEIEKALHYGWTTEREAITWINKNVGIFDNVGWETRVVSSPEQIPSTSDGNIEVSYNNNNIIKLDANYENAGSSQAIDTYWIYDNNSTVVNFVADEAIFEEVTIVITLNGEEVYAGAIPESGLYELTQDGQYGITVHSAVNSKVISDDKGEVNVNANHPYTSIIHIVDTAKPNISISYDSDNISDKYNKDRTATITVTDSNFYPAGVEAVFTAKDVVGNENQTALNDIISKAENLVWTQSPTNPNVHTATLTFSVDANYEFTLKVTDLAENSNATLVAAFAIDKTAPDNLRVEYSSSLKNDILGVITFGFYNPSVTVTVFADDATTGIESFDWKYTKEVGTSDINAPLLSGTIPFDSDLFTYTNGGKTAQATFTIPAQARGSISFSATDRAAKSTDMDDIGKNIVVVDTISPTRKITYPAPIQIVDRDTLDTKVDVDVNDEKTNSIFFYDDIVKATIEIEEANFYAEDMSIKVNGNDYYVSTWSHDKDIHTAELTLSGDGNYIIEIAYTDRSDNEMVLYTSEMITIDGTAPVIDVEYNPENSESNNHNVNRTATIRITDNNFRPSEFESSFTALNVDNTENAVAHADVVSQGNRLKNSGWTEVSPNIYEATLVFSVDAKYDVTFNYTDLAGNKAVEYTANQFAVDKNAPENLRIQYSTPWNQAVLGAITFGYYKPSVVVTIIADDATTGVSHFNWEYNRETNASGVNTENLSGQININEITFSNGNRTATAYFEISAQARGSIKFTATDNAGNSTAPALNDSDNNVVVVDTISPTRTIEYPAPKQIVGKTSLLTKYKEGESGINSYVNEEDTNSIFYYDGNVTATIRIEEANFYKEDVSIKVNGTDYLVSEWIKSNDVYESKLALSGDGDYVIDITYTDRSTNEMKSYKSEQITIDTVQPLVEVSYSPDSPIRIVDNITYYDRVQTATIVVTEHNFRADDIVAAISIKDVTGADISGSLLASLTAHLSNRSSWASNGDKHTAVIEFSADANYTFDIDYHDLALHQITDFPEKAFTVDTTAPYNLDISYGRQSLENVILNTITLGYFQTNVEVAITAYDDTSRIFSFDYSALRAEGVSAKNAATIQQTLAEASIEYRDGGRIAVARFSLPVNALSEMNQFNGTVNFTATDRSGNSTKHADSRRVIVDNIPPVLDVTYNGVQMDSNDPPAYYGKSAEGTVVVAVNVNEANFYSEQVVVSVTKDGTPFSVNVNWSDLNADTHTGTFTLNQDGNYVVNISYTDRSGNVATSHTSNRLTIDTVDPVVKISGIKSDSANNADKIGFTIRSTDDNFDSAKFTPTITAVIMNDDGTFTTRNMSGKFETIADGKEYLYVVENLETDGLYSISCTVTDLAGNSVSNFVVTDSGDTELQEMSFSVNRKGSTFALSENTMKLVERYYVKSGSEDSGVRIFKGDENFDDVTVFEINVDPLQTRRITLNGNELVEDTDYSIESTGGGENWFNYTYKIYKSLFENEGEYNLIIESTDKAENDAYSDIKNAAVNFVVDNTAPVLTISGIKSRGIYNTDSQKVVIIPRDDGGKLNAIKVEIQNRNGVKTDEFTWDSETIESMLDSNEEFSFDILSGYDQRIQIMSTDMAGNDTAETYHFDNVTISTNWFTRLIANTSLFVSLLVGIVLLAGTVVLFVILKRRKKNA